VSFRSLTIKNPTSGTTLETGDEMTRNGDTWTVEEVTERENGDTIVKLTPVEPSEPPVEEDGIG
jgi:hypothetical protein